MPALTAPPTRPRLSSPARLGLLLTLGAAALFVLPFAHAPANPVLSVSYTAGCDNRLAEAGLLLLSAAAVVLASRTGWNQPYLLAPDRAPNEASNEALDGAPTRSAGLAEGAPSNETEADCRPLSRAAIVAAVALTAVFTLALAALILHSSSRYGEANYFLDRTRNVVSYHLAIYRDLEFPYGPLLVYPGVWLARLLAPFHLSVDAAYFLSLTAMNVIGVLFTAYLLNQLPLRHRWRNLLFALSVTEQLHPLAGPNYTLFKFAAPFALFLWAVRRRSLTAQLFAATLAHLTVLLISPELGVGMAAAFAAYAAISLLHGQARPLWLLLAPVASTLHFLAGFGRLFLHRMGQASGGALNLIPEPLPHLIVLGLAVVWLVPVAAGLAIRARSPHAAALAGCFLLALGMLPGALGRCDPLHVFFYGFGFLVLSMWAVQRLSPRRQTVWAAALLLLGLQTQAVNYRLYAGEIATLFRAPPAANPLDLTALRSAIGGAPRVATPILAAVPLATELQLRRAGLFVPEYYPGLAEVWDAQSERRKIAGMRGQPWVLLPAQIELYREPLPNSRWKRLFRLGYRYPQKREPYLLGAALREEIQLHWTPVTQFDGLVLYRRHS